jgi:hypothetical protein
VFKHGDVCPAVVVDPDRQLVAVYTDLTKGSKSRPVVKVLRQPLKRAVAGPVKKGTRLAFIAMYSGQPSAATWANFGGYLVNTGTSNAKAIQRVVGSIGDEDWSRLMGAVRQLESPYSPGLYDIRKLARSESGGAGGLSRAPSAFRVNPVLAIILGVILLPIGFMVLMAVLPALFGRGGGGANPNPAPLVQGPVAGGGAPVAELPPDMPPWMADRIRQNQARRDGLGIPPMGARRNANDGAQAGNGNAETPPADKEENPFQPKPTEVAANDAAGDAENPFKEKPASSDAENPFQPKEPANDDKNPFRPVDSKDNDELKPGQKAEAEWARRWLPVTIKRLVGSDKVEIHWEGYSDNWDEVVPRSRIRAVTSKKK